MERPPKGSFILSKVLLPAWSRKAKLVGVCETLGGSTQSLSVQRRRQRVSFSPKEVLILLLIRSFTH